MLHDKNNELIISFITLRQCIGVLGILLPFVCILGGLAAHFGIRPSVSSYYYTNMRDFFAGLLLIVGVFLITYHGYEKIDSIVNTLTGIAGMGIAFFPCMGADPSEHVGMFLLTAAHSRIIHAVFAAAFFSLLAFNSLFLFTRTNPKKKMTPNKIIRNRIYIACGIAIFASLIALAAFAFFTTSEFMDRWKIVLLLEIVMLFAFGVSWLVKGETLWKDK